MSTKMNQMWSYMNRSNDNIFLISDFLDIANHNTIRTNLKRLTKDGKIVKVMNGIYAIPEYSKLLDKHIYPSSENIAKAIAEKNNWDIVPTGEYALNLLGLSTQVPNKLIYVSDGPYKTYNYNGIDIVFKNTANRYIKGISKNTALMVQAVKEIGKENIRHKEINILKNFHRKNISSNIIKEGRYLPVWIQEIFEEIMRG